MRAAMESPPEINADDGFRQPETMAEWRAWVPRRPKLMIRNHDAGGTNWLPGYELTDAYGGDLLTVLCPKSRQVVTMKMAECKIWKKDVWKQEQLRNSRAKQVHATDDTRIELAPSPEKDPSRFVLYIPKTGLFVGGGGKGHGAAKRTITASLEDADSYPTLSGCYGTRARVAQSFHGVDVKYMTRGEAEKLVTERAKEQEATQSALDALAKEHGERIAEEARKAAEPPPPVVVEVPDNWQPTPMKSTTVSEGAIVLKVPLVPTPPIHTNTTIQAPEYNEVERAIMDEAEAEAMMLEAKGRRIRAEAKAKIEAMRKAQG